MYADFFSKWTQVSMYFTVLTPICTCTMHMHNWFIICTANFTKMSYCQMQVQYKLGKGQLECQMVDRSKWNACHCIQAVQLQNFTCICSYKRSYKLQ